MKIFDEHIIEAVHKEVARLVNEIFDEVDVALEKHTEGLELHSIIGGSAFMAALQNIRLEVLARHGLEVDNGNGYQVTDNLSISYNKADDSANTKAQEATKERQN